MENLNEPRPATGGQRFGESRGWWVVLGVLAVWHALLTLGLFGPDQQAFANLADERPIFSGRHALHLYHGWLGGMALRDRQSSSTFDTSFCAGYPKTPWFDTGSRPAELVQLCVGHTFLPAAYKQGLAWTWALLPLLIALATRAAGLNRSAACLAAFLAMVITWSDFGRQRLAAGDVDLILGSTLGVLAVGCGLLYHRKPNLLTWLALTGLAWAVCACQALLFLTLLPLALLWYFGSGWQHRLFWHLGLLMTALFVVAGNWFWISEALRFWWIRSEMNVMLPPVNSLASLEHLMQVPMLQDPLLVGPAAVVMLLAIFGSVGLHLDGRAVAGRVLAVGASGYLLLGLLGEVGRAQWGIELERFQFTALLLATLPAAQGIVCLFDWTGKATGTSLRGAAVMGAILTTVIIGCYVPLGQFARHCLSQDPLPLGLSDTAQATIELLQNQTTGDARLLWEETPATAAWTPLLPLLASRPCIGGLGPDAAIEHASIRLVDGRLAGRPVAEWTDLELADYCRRYNVGWVACQTPEALERFGKWSLTGFTADLPGGGKLLTLRRPYSYFLTGKGKVSHVENSLITLTDLEPAEGVVVLSFHHHPGIVPSADRVRVEKEPQLYGGIAFVRLRLTGPMARLTLRWDGE